MTENNNQNYYNSGEIDARIEASLKKRQQQEALKQRIESLLEQEKKSKELEDQISKLSLVMGIAEPLMQKYYGGINFNDENLRNILSLKDLNASLLAEMTGHGPLDTSLLIEALKDDDIYKHNLEDKEGFGKKFNGLRERLTKAQKVKEQNITKNVNHDRNISEDMPSESSESEVQEEDPGMDMRKQLSSF